jgi:hypothetical protein
MTDQGTLWAGKTLLIYEALMVGQNSFICLHYSKVQKFSDLPIKLKYKNPSRLKLGLSFALNIYNSFVWIGSLIVCASFAACGSLPGQHLWAKQAIVAKYFS